MRLRRPINPPRQRSIVLPVLASIAFALALMVLFMVWVAATPSGLRFAVWAAGKWVVPGLVMEAPAGRLLGPLSAERIVFETKDRHLVIERADLAWQPRALLSGRHLGALIIDHLRASRLQVFSRPSDEPNEEPADLTLPLPVTIDRLNVDVIQLGELTPPASPRASANANQDLTEIENLAARVISDGRHHRVEGLRFSTARAAVEAEATLDGQAPFPLTGSARLTGEELGHPVVLALEAEGRLAEITVRANSESDVLTAKGEVLLAPFAPQPLARGKLSATGVNPSVWIKEAPHARLDINLETAPLADDPTRIAGAAVIVNREPGRIDEGRLPVRGLEFTFRHSAPAGTPASSENLHIDFPTFTATLTRGQLSGTGALSGGELNLDAQARGIDASTWHTILRPTHLAGKLNAQLSAETQTLKASLRDPEFGVELAATRRNDRIEIEQARLEARGGLFEVSGRLVPAGEYALHGRLQAFDPAFFAAVPSGRLNATLDAKGTLADKPTLDLHFVLADSTLAGRPLAGNGDVLLRPDRLERAEVSLRAGDNRVEVHGRLGAAGDRLDLAIDAPRLEQVGLGGTITGRATLTGALRTPGAEWSLQSPRFALPGKADWRNLVTQGVWQPEGALRIAFSAARLLVSEAIPDITNLSLHVDGQQAAHRIDLSARVGPEGTLRLGGNGGFASGQVWRGDVETLTWNGPHAFRLVDRARLEAGPGSVILRTANFAGDDWRATIEGVDWSPNRLASRGRFTNLLVRPFLPLAAPPSTLRLGGEWAIDLADRAAGHIRIRREQGDLAFAAGDETLFLGLQQLDFNTDLVGRQALVTLKGTGTTAGNVEGRLTVPLRPGEGGWTLASNSAWQGNVRLDVPSIAWLSRLAGENVRLGGRLGADLAIGGTPAKPTTTGQASGSELQVRLLDYGLDLGGGTLRLDMTPETVRLQRLEMVSTATQRPNGGRFDFKRFTERPGRVVAEGELVLGSGDSRIDLRADRLPVSQLPDRWVILSGNGGLRLADGRLAISGDLHGDAAYVEVAGTGQPTLSSDVVIVDRRKDSGGRATPRRTPPRLALDLRVDLGDNFYFRGAGIESRLAGAVRLTAESQEQIRGTGSVHTVGGTFDAYGQELAIERGILNFNGLVTDPGLNVRAIRKNLPVEAGVEVSGTVNDPVVRLVSTPDVPDAEKLSWMVLGRGPNQTLGSQDASLLLSAAMALRGNQGKGPLESLMRGLGLEELSVTSGTSGGLSSSFPTTTVAGSLAQGSSATVTEQIATVGKRIGTHTVVSYERSLSSAENVIKVTYEVTRGLSLIGRVGASATLGLLYTFSFGAAKNDGVPTDAGPPPPPPSVAH